MDRPQTGVLITVSILSGLLGGIVATCLVGGGLVTAQEPAREVPAVVSAKEFRLIDRQGHTRAALSFNEDGQPFLQMRDEFDTERVRVGISRETGVDVRDMDGKTRLVLSVDEEGLPSLVVRDRKHQTKSFHPQVVKTAGAGGIGNMRRGIRYSKGQRRKCGLWTDPQPVPPWEWIIKFNT